MSIQSLGVGSGLALDDLVTQLLEAERKPKQERLDKKEEELDAEISGLGQVKSKMKDFLDTVDELRSDFNLNGREPTIENPTEGFEPFTAEASNSALEGTYDIAITQLASGSRFETADAVAGGFSSSSDTVLSSGSGSLTFKVGATGDSFSINVSAGTTLAQLRERINSASGNFGVNANIIDTGTADGGAKLVFTSDKTGVGNDLVIVNDGNLAELNRVSTTDSSETATYLSPVKSAQNAKATVDGILVESATNEFENTIQNVSFEASDLSALAADGATFQTSKLTIGFDKEGLETKIRDFVDNFNALNNELEVLTRYGGSELEDDGVLAGDSMVRGIQSGLANILSGSVSNSTLGSLFAIGIEFNNEGNLEFNFEDFGLGNGEERLADALDDNFDDVATLFSDPDEGIAGQLYTFVKEYTTFSGILSDREKAVKNEKDQLFDDREQFELRMLNFEQVLRDKYLNLDLTVARLNQTGNSLAAALSVL